MRLLIFIISILLFYGISSAQIDRHIDYDDIKGNPPAHGWAWRRYFWGSFDLEDLPAPLKPTRVNFTLEAVHGDDPGWEGEDWIVKLFTIRDFVRISGDTLFVWPGPHKAGDIYSNSFTFVPLVSGLWGISLKMSKFHKENISMYWCLDADGHLGYLGRDKGSRIYCPHRVVNFFTQDSVHISDHIFGTKTRLLFDYEITIKPTPTIGYTSIIHYKLTAITDIVSDLRIRLSGMCMDFFSVPSTPKLPILAGQTVELFLMFVPQPVRCKHVIRMSLYEYFDKDEKPSYYQKINIPFLFSSDGSLRYANSRGVPIRDEDLPKNYREIDFRRDDTTIYFK